ncbi:MAG: VWA domain-containing protein [Saprospiraceae bacterium]|nr:VWA domain-containing protein [Saprospiraceae bacterium]
MKALKFLLLILISVQGVLTAQDQSESPYFLVHAESDVEAFPLLSNQAEVRINGPIANVEITQSYKNTGQVPIEAVYVFPASTRAAVFHMEMRIGERVIRAEIKEKQKARQTYEQAKSEGKRVSLLEQHKPNVFQMNVANILPGDRIDVVLKYVEFIIPENQVYTFVYPTVVGPRFTGGGKQEQHFVQNPYMKEGRKPNYTFDIKASLNMPFPIIEVGSPSHKVDVNFFANESAEIGLDRQDINGGNRDFILEYKLSGASVASGVQTYSAGDEHFFLCQIEPPSVESNPRVNKKEFVFIVDVSGSMSGFPLDISKELMKNLLAKMQPHDKFNILFFAGSNYMLSAKSMDATQSNIKKAFYSMDQQRGGGGTQLLPALKSALAYEKEDGYARSFIIITDGYVAVEEAAFRLIAQSLGKANFFAFGIGSGVNRYLIEGIANVGRGKPFIVTQNKFAQKEAEKLAKYVSTPLLTDIRISTKNVKLSEVMPPNTPDLLAERPLYYFGKFDGAQNGSITIQGNQGGERWEKTVELPLAENKNEVLKYLWARETIRYLDDFNITNLTVERKDRITQLGLNYNLLTKYTSFVAVDDTPVIEDGDASKTVRQPLPLPQGVSNLAVGFEMDLEETLSDGLSVVKVVDIKVNSTNTYLQKIVESILETILEEYDNYALTALGEVSRVIYFDSKGQLLITKDNQAHWIRLERRLAKAFEQLGLKFPGESFEIEIIYK